VAIANVFSDVVAGRDTTNIFNQSGPDQYKPSVWASPSVNLEDLADGMNLPKGVVTSLLRDLYDADILGSQAPGRIEVTELGKLAYEVAQPTLSRLRNNGIP
jgi:hypothetical protein